MKNRVKELRQAKSLSQAELADTLGVTQAVVSNIETGRQSMTDKQMTQVADALEVHPAELIDDPSWNKIPLSRLNEPLLRAISKVIIKLVKKNAALMDDTVAGIITSLYRRHAVLHATTPAQVKNIEDTAEALVEHELAKGR